MKSLLKAPLRALTRLGDFCAFAARSTWAGVRHPIRPAEFIEFFDSLGVKSIPVILVAGFFAGFSISLFLEGQLEQYGAKMTLGRVIGVTTIRELGPMVVALMLTGRVGASIAATLGSMKIGNQVDAIIALGQDPERKLAAPRIWALTLLCPLLTVIAILATLIGGYLASTVGSGMYWYQAQMAMYFRHLTSGLTKPFVFGWMIGAVSCYFGLRTENGVVGVGKAVSNTVVVCCIFIFVTNALLGMLMILWTGH